MLLTLERPTDGENHVPTGGKVLIQALTSGKRSNGQRGERSSAHVTLPHGTQATRDKGQISMSLHRS